MIDSVLFSNVASRPNGQLLKWVGNKYNYAEEIISYFPADFNKYIEPFVGTGAVLATFSPNKAIAGDTLKPLIEIWSILQNDPKKLINYYRESLRKFAKDKNLAYKEIQNGFNTRQNGLDLLILSRTCYGGVVRFTKEGKMSTPMGPHSPMPLESFEKRVWEWKERVENTEFLNSTFQDTMSLAEDGDIIYCDPPYLDSQSILYGAQSFIFEDLIQQILICKKRGARVVLSIDGKKKSGEKEINIEIPKGLFKREIYLDCGSSMLRRFQSGGKEMSGEDVHDRLLLTW